MKIVDLKAASSAINVEDAKEALVDALLNMTWHRASGAGPEGDLVFAVKPSLRFVSGFLLPRFEETGQIDETSDIHISTHGLDLQIGAVAKGEFTVIVEFAIYVRALPSWEELTLPQHALFPSHPLRRDVDAAIRDEMKRLLAEALAAQEVKPAEQRRSYGDLQQEIYRQLLSQHGVEVEPDVKIAAAGEAPDQSEDAGEESTEKEDEDSARLVVQRGRYIFHNDAAAQPIDIPQKWKRLQVELPVLRAELSDHAGIQRAVNTWTAQARDAIAKTVRDWIATREGQDWAYRPQDILPSHLKSKASWEKFLSNLRSTPATLKTLAPDLSGVSLSVQSDSDLKDHERRNLRVMLENNSNAVRKRMRHRFDPCIHQVRLSVSLPERAHLALKLDRVEPSYRFRDFLTYPAIGVNCGVEERRGRDELRLTTTWMPRYTQPRIVPTAIKDVPTDFLSLAAEGFNPATLRPLVDAYRLWIDGEERDLDPSAGVDDAGDVAREKERFTQDIASYAREADRIALGISLLEQSFGDFRADPGSREALPYRAWQLLNRTFREAGQARGVVNWRLFQLTFILAHLPTLVSRMPEFAKAPWYDHDFDEDTATLLYFPTGGGKSEAFFGLLIFNLFFDRLRGKQVGVTALIRYPLRLLTLQQAQRLLALLVRAELLRQEMSIQGAPLEIGFWVGNANTPNKSDDPRFEAVPDVGDPAHPDDEDLGRDYTEANHSFNKIPRCPICSQSTGLRRIRTGTEIEIGIYCFNRECRWNVKTERSPLPFLLTDRDIYRHAPAVLLGVIDKLALIGQHTATIGRVLGMFGFARWREVDTGRFVTPSRTQLKDGCAANDCEAVAPSYPDGAEVFCDPFPSLIIQDEAHLLEESLGTFAGLFETTLEQLFVRGASLLGSRVARGPLGDGSPKSATIAERVQAILGRKELTLYRVSQESSQLYGRSSPYFLPHNLYYDLRTGAFRPSIHQIAALSRISGYRMADWLRVFGYNLEDITRLQILLPSKRTIVLDTSLTDLNEWISWFDDRRSEASIPRITPLAKFLKAAPARRIHSLQNPSAQDFLYAKIGWEDALAFPDLLPGSIVRVNPDVVDRTPRDHSAISDHIFLVEHSKGFCCCRIRMLANGAIVPFDNGFRHAQVELRCPQEARLWGTVDFEFRPLLRIQEPVVPNDLARHWKPQSLPAHESFGQLLKRTRQRSNLSVREAAQMSRTIAEILKDERYATSPSSLSDYELHNAAPRDFHKIVTLCSVYGLQYESVTRRIGVDTAKTGAESMPDRYLSRDSSVAVANNADAGYNATGFLERLVKQCEEIPLFLRHSLEYFCGSTHASLDDFFWVGGDDNPLHPYLEKGLVVMVNRRRKTPIHFVSKDLWQQPLYVILKRDGTYLAACCGVENGALIVYPYARDFRRNEEYRVHRDADVVGQILAIARRLF